ncbi:MAG: thiopurine S-methyltransferase [Glaciecola sp.]|jgi:thiopurine S-methyltransferase
MQADFWHRRWQKNEIGFHEEDGNHLFKTYFDELALDSNARVFVPLCGKTKDIAWLLSKGYHVVGIELNESAIEQLFEDLGIKASQIPNTQESGLKRFHNEFSNGLTLDVYQGDFFTFTAELLGNIDAVFDRAALVALPAQMRTKYSEHLLQITGQSKQLLVCYQYEEGLIQGPPHSVSANEVNVHYQHSYLIECLYTGRVEGGFREKADVFETAYLLFPN